MPVGQLRSRLRQLDINNSRILDIHYPTRNVVALLVHNDYAPELKSYVQKLRYAPRTTSTFAMAQSSWTPNMDTALKKNTTTLPSCTIVIASTQYYTHDHLRRPQHTTRAYHWRYFHTHRVQILYNWTKSHDMIIWNERLTYESPIYMTFNGSSIIDYFIVTTELPYPQLLIRGDLSVDSYHKFMTLSFQLTTLPSRTNAPKRILWHLNKIKDDQSRP
ncbi:uncharacterized protein RHIMIDRAFT_288140 [Rhizopus microsporus ATCC 52813]|uniref:Endonuclease/exonuclease/phosphatase domain-containing protein n=1 Tax=Rhizopus microsporus ATCC 52813 TaxID=1340429 RepID=A0A2G4T845_RHIZD|nr:uncharacterized protein RHIMIDRAFT_288140 [Rhizopus microsporus ATCC 52813]PHZ17195.1 hypothetical protein RHIMIDRAFT_288140 [Rhizopus microsporus ATCC 52813]